MRRFLAPVLAVASVLLAGCDGHATDPASASLLGKVVAGPTCPVEREGSPCPPRPWTGTVGATDEDGRSYSATTTDEGSFSMSVPPGSYTVVAVTGSGLPRGVPQTVTLSTGAEQTITLVVDTGIR
jgi:hypothetical protein